MAVKERSQIKGTDAQIKAFAGHNGVLAFATDTKSLHVLSGTAGTTTEFLPSTKVATKAELGSYATSETLTTELAKKANTADVNATFANYTPTASLATVATSGNYGDLSGKPTTYEVGDIKLYAGSNVPDGWFRCDGSTIADMATNYPKLYAVLGTNVLPNYSGAYPLGATSDINSTVPAGLPNIEGKISFHGSMSDGSGGTVLNHASGAFTGSFVQNNYRSSSISTGAKSFGSALFSASASNAIYGKSTTVQPPSVKVAVLIRHD